RERWLLGERPPAEVYLGEFFHLQHGDEHALDLVFGEYLLRQELGERPAIEDYAGRFPRFADALRLQAELRQAVEGLSAHEASDRRETVRAAGAAALPRGPRVPGYEVLGLLGRGGMGVVYMARHLALNRVVALKLIRGGPEATEEARARFRA